MDDLRLYIVSDRYIDYLRSTVDGHVFANRDPRYVHTRKYLGVVIAINGYNYYAPLSSPKDTDYQFDKNGSRCIRKSIVPIIRITDTKQDGTAELLGTIKFSGMIPVPVSELVLYDIDNETDTAYKDLVNKEIRFINRHTPEILRSASVLYKQKVSGQIIGYLNSTLDFKSLEKAHDNYLPTAP